MAAVMVESGGGGVAADGRKFGVPLPLPPYRARKVGFGPLAADGAEEALALPGCAPGAPADDDDLLARIKFLGSSWDLASSDVAGYADALAKLVDRASDEVAAAAAEALGNLGAAGAGRHADALTAALERRGGGARSAAAYALGAVKAAAPTAVPAPIPLEDDEQSVRLIAERLAVAAATSGSSADAIEVRMFAVQALGRLRASEHADLVAERLNGDESEMVQAAACIALAGMQAVSRASEIAAKLRQDDTRLAAVSALGLLGSEVVRVHAGDIVSTALSSSDMHERAEALTALALCKGDLRVHTDVGAQLSRLLGDDAPALRAAAALALGGLGEVAQGSADSVAALLADCSEDQTWLPHQVGGGAPREPMAMRKPRCAAAVAIGGMGSARHAADLAALLEDQDWEVRFCALEALAALGPAAAADLGSRVAARLDDATYVVRAKACACLAAIGASDEAGAVAELLKDQAQLVRTEAVSALAALGQPAREFASDVANLLDDVSNNVRAAAVATLASFGAHGQPFAGAIARLLSDAQPDVRAAACLALGRLGDYGACFADEIVDLLEDPASPASLRAAAAQALGSMGPEGAAHAAALRRLCRGPAGCEDVAAAEKSLRTLEEQGHCTAFAEGPGAIAALEVGVAE